MARSCATGWPAARDAVASPGCRILNTAAPSNADRCGALGVREDGASLQGGEDHLRRDELAAVALANPSTDRMMESSWPQTILISSAAWKAGTSFLAFQAVGVHQYGRRLVEALGAQRFEALVARSR